jgi:hypothetical protein
MRLIIKLLVCASTRMSVRIELSQMYPDVGQFAEMRTNCAYSSQNGTINPQQHLPLLTGHSNVYYSFRT